MIEDYALLIGMIIKSNDFVGEKIKSFVGAIPRGILKAMSARRPECSLAINDKAWYYLAAPDGIFLASESKDVMPGDQQLELLYTVDDLEEIEPGYCAIMARYNNIAMVARKGEETSEETDYYDFEITKLSETKFKVDVFWTTSMFEFKNISSKEIDLEEEVRLEEEKNANKAGAKEQQSEETNAYEKDGDFEYGTAEEYTNEEDQIDSIKNMSNKSSFDDLFNEKGELKQSTKKSKNEQNKNDIKINKKNEDDFTK